MQKETPTPEYILEDEIDLRELFRTIMGNKKTIIIITVLITLLAIVYVLVKTPIYEAKAIVEIGQYKQADKDVLVDNASRLVKELEVLYIDVLKNEKDRQAWVENISAFKGQNNFIELTSRALDNDKAKSELNKVVAYIADKHQKKINEVIETKKNDLKEIDRKIDVLKKNTLPTLEEKIASIEKNTLPSIEKKLTIHEKTLRQYESQLSSINKSLQKTKERDASLSALDLMEKRNVEDNIEETKLKIVNLESQKEDINMAQLPKIYRDKEELLNVNLAKLEEERNLILLDLQPHNYQNSAVVGQIITSDYPVKPKKKLIVAVAFMTGLILSVFLVFFMEFVKGMREKEIGSN